MGFTNSKIHMPTKCDYCNNIIASDEDNYAGYFDNFCCKRCNDAADAISFNNS